MATSSSSKLAFLKLGSMIGCPANSVSHAIVKVQELYQKTSENRSIALLCCSYTNIRVSGGSTLSSFPHQLRGKRFFGLNCGLNLTFLTSVAPAAVCG